MIRLINVPYDSGKYGQRMGYGPIQLIQNLMHKIRTKVGHIEVMSVEADQEFPSEISTTFMLLDSIKHEVADAFSKKEFPLLLSGNCSTSVAVVAAYSKAVGVIWFDAHADCETPDTTSSGFLDGMALSMLLKRSWKNKLDSLINAPVHGSQVVLIGSREISAFEKAFITENKIHVASVTDIRSNSQVLLNIRQSFIDADVTMLHLHLDVDVIDPEVAIANSYSVPGGLLTNEVIDSIEFFREKIPITSAVISSFDPVFDRQGKMLGAIEQVINCIIR
jgi:arginase